MSGKFQAPRGTQDILPGEVEKWQALEDTGRALSQRYGYREIRTPLFESTDLFARGVGGSSDIVRKEMYTFEDRKGRSLTLRPEGTAGVARAVIEAGLAQPDRVHKLYYWGPMFRYDRPQAGRYRQFHQWGAEIVGSANPRTDVEIILLLIEFLRAIGLTDLEVKLNSVGDAACRPIYEAKIREVLTPRAEELCGDCRERLEKNPLRVFDCKVPSCKAIVAGLPPVSESLCEACREHLAAVRAGLDALQVTYEMDAGLVRGLDYYTRTAFEVHHGKLGAQSAVGGGGRYDGLYRLIGGPEIPAVGFSMGVERALIAQEEEGKGELRPTVSLYLARSTGLTDDAARLARDLRREFVVYLDFEERALGNQLRQADKLGARFALILGEEEAKAGEITIKDLTNGEQTRVAQADAPAAIRVILDQEKGARSNA